MIEAFVYEPEMKVQPGLAILPKMGAPKIDKLEICNAQGKPLTETPSYGQSIVLKVHTLNMMGKTIKLGFWEKDTMVRTPYDPLFHEPKKNTLLSSGIATVKNRNGIAEAKIVLNLNMAMQANKPLYDKSNHQYFIVAEAENTHIDKTLNTNAKETVAPARPARPATPAKPARPATPKKVEGTSIFDTIDIAIKNILAWDPFEADTTNKKVVVEVPDERKKEAKNTCNNCDKDITLDEIKKICSDDKGNCLISNIGMITSALPYLNKYRKKVGINTCVRKAHFLAQISQESKFYDLEEGFNYYWEALISTFGAFTSIEGKKNAKLWGRAIKDRNAVGYKAVTEENEDNIANWAYKDKNSNNNFDSGDGSKYRGRGFKQITWKSNYKDLSSYFNLNMKIDNEQNVDWVTNYNNLTVKPKDAITSALAFWGKNNINSVANENNAKAVEKVTRKINAVLKGLVERKQYFKNAVKVLNVDTCKKGSAINIEKGTVIIVSGTDTKKVADPAVTGLKWVMYKTSVFKDMSLKTFRKLQSSNKLPDPNFITHLSRDTHQTYSKKQGSFKHSDKRFGQYNEIPPGEYFLVPGLAGQSYKIYVIDSESKSAGDANGISGVDGNRGGVALHHYCPRFSVGCFTFNSGKSTTPVTDFINQITDLELNDDKPVRFIVEERKVVESTWDDVMKGTKKWTGI